MPYIPGLRARANASAGSARSLATGNINAGPGEVSAGARAAENVVVVRVVAAGGTADVLESDAADGAVTAWVAGGGAVLVVLLDIDGVAVHMYY